MKKLLLVCLAGLFALPAFTQGNVGIGTTTPAITYKLHVHESNVGQDVSIGLTNSLTGPDILRGGRLRFFSSDFSIRNQEAVGNLDLITANNINFKTGNGNSTRMTVNQYGNVGIGISTPAEQLHVTQTADANKNVIYGYANQLSSGSDYQNTGVTGFGQGNGISGGFGYGFGIKGIGSLNSYGAVGVYAGLGTTIPQLTTPLNNAFYALYADVGTAAGNRYAGVFLNGNVGIGTTTPVEKIDVVGNIQTTGTIKGASHTFPAPKTYYYSMSGSDFIGKISLDDDERETIAGGGVFQVSGFAAGLTGALHLPHGAVITKMTVFFKDISATVDLQVGLRQNSSAFAMASISSSGIPGETSLFDNSISSSTIDNSLYAYTIDVDAIGGSWPNVSLILRKVIFEYTISSL